MQQEAGLTSWPANPQDDAGLPGHDSRAAVLDSPHLRQERDYQVVSKTVLLLGAFIDFLPLPQLPEFQRLTSLFEHQRAASAWFLESLLL